MVEPEKMQRRIRIWRPDSKKRPIQPLTLKRARLRRWWRGAHGLSAYRSFQERCTFPALALNYDLQICNRRLEGISSSTTSEDSPNSVPAVFSAKLTTIWDTPVSPFPPSIRLTE